ncbi:MAG: hypothetical protein E7255_06795 [Lachnospiraceae bacterium]|mgnify:CR=1 FL=1|nr:hypothetical protein [Lachnospiraceae bacterium]
MLTDYVHFLMINLVYTNERFGNAFRTYQQEHPENKECKATYNEEFVDFMIKMIRDDKNYDFTSYNKLEELFQYIDGDLRFEEKRDQYNRDHIEQIIEKRKKMEKHELWDYSFHDSHLLKLETNNRKKECKLFFHGVLVYGDKRKNKENDRVEAGDILVTLMDVKEIKLDGTLDFEFLKWGRVYEGYMEKTSDSLYRFSLLNIVNNEHLIIEIVFSKIRVDDFEYDESKDRGV